MISRMPQGYPNPMALLQKYIYQVATLILLVIHMLLYLVSKGENRSQ